jgi:hypothetical protein
MPDFLRLLWDRADIPEPVFSAQEVAQWPQGALTQLVRRRLLAEAVPATTATCDACGTDHVEEVNFIEAPPGTGRRAYIHCPEVGRVRLPLESLRRWGINFMRLTEVVATAIGSTGHAEEVARSRLWLLGKVRVGGLGLEAFLARGLPWADAAKVILASPRLRATKRPLVLVPNSVPAADALPVGCAPVVPLSALLSWDGKRVSVDQDYLVTVATDACTEPALSQTQYAFLDALYDLNANSADQRLSAEDIAAKAEGKQAQSAKFKEAGSALRSLGLVDVKRGRNGGYWLKPSGHALVERLRKR